LWSACWVLIKTVEVFLFEIIHVALSCTRPDRPCDPPRLLHNEYLVILGVKRSRRCVNHPPAFSAEVKERVELYLYSPSVPLLLLYMEPPATALLTIFNAN
jgi:hypothetical protein